jgi:hypothetical protein
VHRHRSAIKGEGIRSFAATDKVSEQLAILTEYGHLIKSHHGKG